MDLTPMEADVTHQFLSPAAQAVLDAVNRRWPEIDDDIPAQIAAAAICAAADQMTGLIGDLCHPKYLKGVEASADFLEKIAAELLEEPGTSTITTVLRPDDY